MQPEQALSPVAELTATYPEDFRKSYEEWLTELAHRSEAAGDSRSSARFHRALELLGQNDG